MYFGNIGTSAKKKKKREEKTNENKIRKRKEQNYKSENRLLVWLEAAEALAFVADGAHLLARNRVITKARLLTIALFFAFRALETAIFLSLEHRMGRFHGIGLAVVGTGVYTCGEEGEGQDFEVKHGAF